MFGILFLQGGNDIVEQYFKECTSIVLQVVKVDGWWKFSIRVGSVIRDPDNQVFLPLADLSEDDSDFNAYNLIQEWASRIYKILEGHNLGGGGITTRSVQDGYAVTIRIALTRRKPGAHG